MSLTVVMTCDVCDTRYEKLGLPRPFYLPSLRKLARNKGWGTFLHPNRKRVQDCCPTCAPKTRLRKDIVWITSDSTSEQRRQRLRHGRRAAGTSAVG